MEGGSPFSLLRSRARLSSMSQIASFRQLDHRLWTAGCHAGTVIWTRNATLAGWLAAPDCKSGRCRPKADRSRRTSDPHGSPGLRGALRRGIPLLVARLTSSSRPGLLPGSPAPRQPGCGAGRRGSRCAPSAGRRRRGSRGSPTGRSCRGGPDVPDGRPATVAAATTVPAAPEGEILTSEGVAYIVSAIEAVVGTLRGVDEDVDAEDPTSAGIVEDLIGKLEQQAWFLSSEIRKPVR